MDEVSYTRKVSGGTLDQLMQAASSKGVIMDIDLGKIRTLSQVRKNFRKIDELAQSLIKEGQQTPIIVSPVNSEGIYILQKGERRFRAAQKAGMKTIRAIINEVAENKLEETAGQLIENIQRENLDAMEIALALKVFADAGWSQNQIGERIGKSQVYVSRHLSMLSLPDIVLELFDAGIVSDVITLSTLRVLYEEDKAAAERLCRKAMDDDGLSRNLAADALRDVRKRKEQSGQDLDTDEEQSELNLNVPGAADYAEPPADKAHQPQQPAFDVDEDEGSTDYRDHSEQIEDHYAQFDEDDEDDLGNVQRQLASRPSTLEAPDGANEQVPVADNESVSIDVSFVQGDESLPGTLMLNIVSPAPSFAWVKDRNGTLHLVNVTRIAINSVRAKAEPK